MAKGEIMRFRSAVRRMGVATTATALVSGVVLGSAPASAMSTGAGVVVATRIALAESVVATLSYDATPFPGGSIVTFNCKALAWADPASTGIGECGVYGTRAVNSPNNYPGAASTAAGVVFVPDGVEPEGCVEGHATFIVGGGAKTTGVKCDPLPLVALPAVAAE